ncbi:Endonuclease/exonuclease/phosphatase [Lipomyces japonicus]|uniref:Endonuclease/exonuclease/phosphatase n=1 Tax=Lipomyces japonicus TaxID=56871 RepID=UPI0034CFE149
MVLQHWQHQVHLAQLSRQSSSPHHHARAAAAISRGSAPPAGLSLHDLSNSLLSNGSNSSLMPKNFGGHTRLDSADVDGLQVPVIERPEKTRQDWAALDMSGQGLRNLSPALFNYDFLDKLYLNHNRLNTLPPAICKLKHLTILDISGNLLSAIPPEIGLAIGLKMLLLFDNNVSVLPWEMGQLFQLELLGIEGNPLPETTKSVMAKDGTRGVIIDLRDNAPMPLPPPPRDWLVIEEKETDENTGEPIGSFSVASYNILCDKYATPILYGYTPSWALTWDYRKESIKDEIANFNADIVSLQEVDSNTYEDFLTPFLAQKDYKGYYYPKTRSKTMGEVERRRVDGCALFYKTTTFKLLEQHYIEYSKLAIDKGDIKNCPDLYNRVFTKDQIGIVCFLEHIKTGNRLIVANSHVYWDPKHKDVKLIQSGILMEEVTRLSKQFAKIPPSPDASHKIHYKDGTQIPLIIAGDFNSTPDSGVYQLFAKGSVPGDHPDMQGYKYGRFTEEGLSHPFTLKSSYAAIGEPSFTNWTPGFTDTIDYIFASSNNLTINGVIGEPDKEYMSKVVGFPTPHFPSDHISLFAQLQFRK